MGVIALFFLSSLGSAIIAQAQQCSKPLGGSNMQLKDEYITQETFPDGSTVSFRCDSGYTPTRGSAGITCNAGVWSTVLLKCERKNCGALEEVDNGNIDYNDGTEFGDRAVITCNVGYTLVGQSVLRCEAGGWSGRLPVCEVVKCLPPAGIVNGTFSPMNEFYQYRDVVRYSCNNNDLVLNGSRELVCLENEKFSPAPPVCVWVECKDPVIENSVFESGSRPPHRYKAIVTYSCKSGYKMDGQSTLTCNLNSQWSSSVPKCIKSSGTTRPPVTTTTTTTTTTPATTSPTGNKEGLSPGIIILIVLVIFIPLIIIIVVIYRKKRARRRSAVKEAPKDGEDVALSLPHPTVTE